MTGKLSPRQREVLALLAEGHTDHDIAAHLHVCATTAKRHVLDIRTKLGARNRAHAVAIGYRTGQIGGTA